MSLTIPQSSPLANYLSHKDEIDAAIKRTLESGWYILGQEVESFEKEFAAYLGAGQAVGVNSGTDALYLALRACEVGPGDDVLTVSHTAVATVAAIEQCGATPVFVDIEPDTFNLDPSLLRASAGLGASGFYTFCRVYFPLSLHGVLSGALIVYILSIGFFITPALMGGQHDIMIAMLIDRSLEVAVDWPAAALMSLTLLVVTLALYAVYYRLTDIRRLIGAR